MFMWHPTIADLVHFYRTHMEISPGEVTQKTKVIVKNFAVQLIITSVIE